MRTTQYQFPADQLGDGAPLDALDDPAMLAFLAAAVDLADYAADLLAGTAITNDTLRERVEFYWATASALGADRVVWPADVVR